MFQVRNILAPVEFDQLFPEVAQAAVSLATQFQAKLFFLHVDDPLAGTPSLVAGSIHSPSHTPAELQKHILDFVPLELLSAARATYHVRKGDPVEEIVDFATTQLIDLIVLGNSRESFFAKLFFSSIEEELISKAPCHVLAVSPKKR